MEKIEKWIKFAWENVCKDSFGRSGGIPRDILWKECAWLAYPLFHYLEQTRKRFKIDKNIVIIPEYRRGTPLNAECTKKEHQKLHKKSSYKKFNDTNSIDLCLARFFSNQIEGKYEERENYWCYGHELIAAIEIKNISKSEKDLRLVKQDLNKLEKLKKEECKNTYMCIFLQKERIKDFEDELKQIAEQTQIKYILGTKNKSEWGIYNKRLSRIN